MTTKFWSGKRVVLLGGAGLIGTHIAKALISKGDAQSVGIVDDLSSGKKSNISWVREYDRTEGGFWSKELDLRNYDNAMWAVKDEDIVFHLAAQHGGRGYVAAHDVELYDNLSLDTTIFRACADASVEKVVFSSSACAYPVDLQTNVDEFVYLSEEAVDYKKMRQADGAYGTEKLLGEMILDAYIEKGYFKGCSTRSFTVYGPLMGETHAIAALIAKTMVRSHPYEIWGSGEQVRNWTYVEDNVAGALLAAEHLDRGAINIGIEDRLTPWMAANKIWDYMGWRPMEIVFRKDRPVGPQNRVADSSKLKALGWTPKYTFEEGLRKTIDWYVENHDQAELEKDLERRLTER